MTVVITGPGPFPPAQTTPINAPRTNLWYTDGPVYALVETNGVLYLGGDFSQIGPSPAQMIPRVCAAAIDEASGTATQWNPNCQGPVWAFALAGSIIYLGGDFGTVSGLPRSQIAAVDAATGIPTVWNPAVGGHVRALAVSGNTVYVGGDFVALGGQPRTQLGALDALTGQATAWNPAAQGLVSSLLVSGSVIYAGGAFKSVGGQPRVNLAAVDLGSAQATIWSPNPNGPVNSLALAGASLCVGGSYSAIAGSPRSNLAAFDLATGALLPWRADTDGPVLALATSYGTLYAGGQFYAIGGQNRTNIAQIALGLTTNNVTDWIPTRLDNSLFNQPYVDALAATRGTIFAGGDAYFGAAHQPNLGAFDTPAVLETFTASQTGFLGLGVLGAPGRQYVLQGSANLLSWSPVATNLGPFTAQVGPVTNLMQFYRVISPTR